MRRALAVGAIWAALLALPAVAGAGGAGQISGTVTPIAIAPEVEVCLAETRPSEICTSPNAGGNYTLTGLPTTTPLRVEFIPSYRSHYAIQYYDHGRTLGEALVILLPAEAPQRSGVDADLELGGAITGKATAASSGTPLTGVEVCAIESPKRVNAGCAETNEAGEYRLGGLAPGSYKVGFWGRGKSSEFTSVYYSGQPTEALATPASISAGAIVAGINAALVKGAKIVGTVSAATTGLPLEGTPVCLFAATASLPSQCVYTEAGGTYSIVGLSAGSYQVGFSLGSAEIGGEAVSSEDDGYRTQYYHGVANRSEAQTLMLSGEQIAAGIDAQLLTPVVAPPPLPPAPLVSNVVAAPPAVTEPSKPKPLQCKKGFAKKKVKGVVRCVKKKPTRKHRQRSPAKKHRKHPKNHGAIDKNRRGRH